jgi:hypothetical protein
MNDGILNRKAQHRSYGIVVAVVYTLFDLLIITMLFWYANMPLFEEDRGLRLHAWLGDMYEQNMPISTYTGQAMRQGRIPLWNPSSNLGSPYLAYPYVGALYPSNAIYGGSIPFFHAYRVDVLSHLYLMSVFGYILGRRIAGSRCAGLFLAASLILSGLPGRSVSKDTYQPFSAHLDAWVPLALLALLEVLRAKRSILPVVALAGVVCVSFLAGDEQRFVYLFAGLGVFTLLELSRRLVVERAPIRRVANTATAALVGVILGLLLASAQALPSWELLGESIRSNGADDVLARANIFRPSQLLEGLLRNAPPLSAAPIVLGFALSGLATNRVTIAWPLFLVSVILALFALGYRGPFFPAIADVPIISSMRVQSRAIFFAQLFLFTLGSIGVGRLVSRESGRCVWVSLLIALAVLLLSWATTPSFWLFAVGAVVLVGAGCGMNQLLRLNASMTATVGLVFWTLPWLSAWVIGQQFEVPGAWLFALRMFAIGVVLRPIVFSETGEPRLPVVIVFGVMMLSYSMTERWLWPQYEMIALFGLVVAVFVRLTSLHVRSPIRAPMVVCLLLAIYGFVEVEIPHDFETSEPAAYEVNQQYVEFLSSRRDNDRIVLINHNKGNSIKRTERIHQLTGLPFEARMLSGYGPIPTTRYARLCNAYIDKSTVEWNEDGELVMSLAGLSEAVHWLNNENAWLLDLLNIRWIATTPRRSPYIESQLSKGRFKRKRSSSKRLTIYENTTAFPHVYLADRVTVANTEEELFSTLRGAGERRRTTAFVLADEAPFIEIPSDAAGGSATLESYASETVVVRTSTAAPTVLIVTDSWYPGWQYRVDGASWQEAFPVNYVFRGAAVPGGRHLIEFAFRPGSFRWGGYLSLSVFVLLAVLTSVEFVRRRRIKEEPSGGTGPDAPI